MNIQLQLSRKAKLIIAGVIVVPIFILALYTWISLTWSYSEGTRAGYVQKFSHKGWICKTWEGELAQVNIPGSLSEKFLFTVRDAKVVDYVNASLGKRVALTYEEHRGVPTTCFGDTRYYITAVRVVE
jgi:hypothetical protein